MASPSCNIERKQHRSNLRCHATLEFNARGTFLRGRLKKGKFLGIYIYCIIGPRNRKSQNEKKGPFVVTILILFEHRP